MISSSYHPMCYRCVTYLYTCTKPPCYRSIPTQTYTSDATVSKVHVQANTCRQECLVLPCCPLINLYQPNLLTRGNIITKRGLRELLSSSLAKHTSIEIVSSLHKHILCIYIYERVTDLLQIHVKTFAESSWGGQEPGHCGSTLLIQHCFQVSVLWQV